MWQTFNLIPTLSAAENVETALVPLEVPTAQRTGVMSSGLLTIRPDSLAT